ncbi:CcoQ/FixQ family Cbb3-type cytochrome c oxidase assembly chaperone, partial [Campylobacter jejuni]|uniref:CcoQ/FixQ family Cbb3-type cytochrome c oxidase assembly chaperone n=1 Tax=Campylobacter jejuni TaxID=197 RepID=UPI002F25F0D7
MSIVSPTFTTPFSILPVTTVQKHEWEIFQGYGFFALVMFLSIVLYAYWYHLYRTEKKGE